jgi:signal transduction histidine kinase
MYKNYNVYVLNNLKEVVYQNNNVNFDSVLVNNLKDNTISYKINNNDKLYYINSICEINVQDQKIYIQISKDISSIFEMKNDQINMLLYMLVIVASVGSIFIYGISFSITRPIRKLIESVKNISSGNYNQRLNIKGKGEIGELANEFNIMAEAIEKNITKLENIASLQENFVSNFTHELKTPLTSIIGYSDMLRTKILSQEVVHNSSNYIYSEGKRLEALTIKLLDLISLNNKAFVFKKTNTTKLINNVTAIMNPIISKRRIKLNLNIEDSYIKIDEDLVKTLLLNILDNSIKASKEDSVIEVAGIIEDKQYQIKVKDYGIGIKKEEIEKITEPFYMVDKSRTSNQKSLGLGLNLCKKIADIHNAKLNFESEFGKYTIVTFKIDIDNSSN